MQHVEHTQKHKLQTVATIRQLTPGFPTPNENTNIKIHTVAVNQASAIEIASETQACKNLNFENVNSYRKPPISKTATIGFPEPRAKHKQIINLKMQTVTGNRPLAKPQRPGFLSHVQFVVGAKAQTVRGRHIYVTRSYYS